MSEPNPRPTVRPLQLVTMEELAEAGWRETRWKFLPPPEAAPVVDEAAAAEHTATVAPIRGKRPAGDFAAFADEAPPLLRLRPLPEPPEAA